MAITSMGIGPEGEEAVIRTPPWNDVLVALRMLDGQAHDSIALDLSEASYMGIAGGADGRYVVAGTLEHSGPFICASGAQGQGTMDVAVCGDFNSYASENVVPLDTAIEAARVFFEYGKLAGNLKWERARRPV